METADAHGILRAAVAYAAYAVYAADAAAAAAATFAAANAVTASAFDAALIRARIPWAMIEAALTKGTA
jgi:hypothetical protein